MTALDLTVACEAVARGAYERQFPYAGTDWDALPPINKTLAREAVLPYVVDAAPLIEAQVRARVAAEIRELARHREDRRDAQRAASIAERRSDPRMAEMHMKTAQSLRSEAIGLRDAAVIARGEAS